MRVCYQWYDPIPVSDGGETEAVADASTESEQAEAEDAALTLAVCVRPFSPVLWGTETVSVQPYQVQEWVAHHVSLGFQRLYLFDRPRAASLPTLAQVHLYAVPSVCLLSRLLTVLTRCGSR